MIIVEGGQKRHGFIFSLLNPPVPLGGNIISLDVYVDEFPLPKKSVFVATPDDVVNAAALSESRPIPFKPFQSARFLVMKEGGLDDKKKHKIVVMSKMEGFEQILIPFTFADHVGYRSGKIIIPETAQSPEPLAPGDPIEARLPAAARDIRVTMPDGQTIPLSPADPAMTSYPTELAGLYTLTWRVGAEEQLRQYAVNLFDEFECDITPAESIRFGRDAATTIGRVETVQKRALWPWALAAALIFLCIEWIVYNRRAYI